MIWPNKWPCPKGSKQTDFSRHTSRRRCAAGEIDSLTRKSRRVDRVMTEAHAFHDGVLTGRRKPDGTFCAGKAVTEKPSRGCHAGRLLLWCEPAGTDSGCWFLLSWTSGFAEASLPRLFPRTNLPPLLGTIPAYSLLKPHQGAVFRALGTDAGSAPLDCR